MLNITNGLIQHSIHLDLFYTVSELRNMQIINWVFFLKRQEFYHSLRKRANYILELQQLTQDNRWPKQSRTQTHQEVLPSLEQTQKQKTRKTKEQHTNRQHHAKAPSEAGNS
jgi:hypothetical protein